MDMELGRCENGSGQNGKLEYDMPVSSEAVEGTDLEAADMPASSEAAEGTDLEAEKPQPMPSLACSGMRVLSVLVRFLEASGLLMVTLSMIDVLTVPVFKAERTLKDVTLMVTVTDGDFDSIHARIPSISDSIGGVLDGNRYFVVDAHRTNGTVSEALNHSMAEMIRLGYMDRVMVYSNPTVDRLERDRRWGGRMMAYPRIGNMIYYAMPEVCPTRYLVHYDLDIVSWSRPGQSWISKALQLFQHFEKLERKVWYISPSTPWYFKYLGQFDWNFLLYRCIRAFLSLELLQQTESKFINSQVYMIDISLYRKLTAAASLLPAVVDKYSSTHWEGTLNTLSHELGYRRTSMMDCTAAWAVHMDEPFRKPLHPPPGTVRQGFAGSDSTHSDFYAGRSEWLHAQETLSETVGMTPFAAICISVVTSGFISGSARRCLSAAPMKR
ncbi:unnamed protein product [Polarella glacialis]|uniref:Uncharacterized protein n=2 Tax=Polarella glacialis TaxID=89957 RepID=A0A813LYA2_POLGL|nr:unnamed protein product [Polarella glacialis]